MDIIITSLFSNWEKVYGIFKLWTIALVVATFLIMQAVGFGYRKLFALGKQTDGKTRIRKTVTSLSVFIVSALVAFIFVKLISKANMPFKDIVSASIPLGVLAMLLRAMFKLVRDFGWKPVIKAIAESNAFKTYLTKELKIDGLTYDITKEFVKTKLADVDTLELQADAQKLDTYINDLSVKLSGFVDKPRSVATGIITNYLKGQK